MKNNKQLETILFSAGGVAAMLLILLALNFVLHPLRARVDLTAEKAFTLSKGTKRILEKLDTPVKIRLYVTQGNEEMPPPLKTYAQQVEDLLAEYRNYSKGKVKIEKLNPAPDSDAEDAANLDGIEGQFLRSGEKVYLGLSLSMLDQRVALPFLPPDRERTLEYDISRAIAQLNNAKKPVVGVMSSLPVFGSPANPMQMQMGRQGQEPWVIITELKKDFDVRQVELSVDKIDEAIKLLVVIHPKNLSEKAQYAIDQFLMRGGRLIAMLDPQSLADQGNPMMRFQGPQGGSNLEKLLPAWGIQYEPNKVVADLSFPTPLRRGRNVETSVTWLLMNNKAIDTKDVVTAQIDSLLFAWSGTFSGTPVAGLKENILVHSSPRSQLVEGMMATMSNDAITQNFSESKKEMPLAIRLTGKFKTAFPNGKPADTEPKEEADKNEPRKPENNEPQIKEAKEETTVVLIGDSDLIENNVACRMEQTIFGERVFVPQNGNLTFVQNLVDQLAGDSNLMEMRSRGTISRPFTKIQEMQAQAQKDLQEKIKVLEREVQDAQSKIAQLQGAKDKSQRFILSPDQQKEVERMKQAQVNANKELKKAKKELKRAQEGLQNKLKWVNIATMPVVVSAFGIILAVYKRKLTAAK